jgi:hypothetical protein
MDIYQNWIMDNTMGMAEIEKYAAAADDDDIQSVYT